MDPTVNVISKILYVDRGLITIPCKCGINYHSERKRFHVCSACGWEYDLRPDLPRDSTKFGEIKTSVVNKQ